MSDRWKAKVGYAVVSGDALSLQRRSRRAVFEEVDNVARELNVSRSRVVGIALEEFLKRRENQRLLEQINAAYDEAPMTDNEEAFLRFGRREMRKLLDRRSDAPRRQDRHADRAPGS